MPIYDFRCGEGHVTESRQEITTGTISCRCGLTAKRQSVYPISFDMAGGTLRETRQSNADFFEARDLVADSYERRESSGDPFQKPDLVGEAKRRARKMGAHV